MRQSPAQTDECHRDQKEGQRHEIEISKNGLQHFPEGLELRERNDVIQIEQHCVATDNGCGFINDSNSLRLQAIIERLVVACGIILNISRHGFLE
ncbi:hypothetical protein SDC9_91159 [bioreactor metagenome]|uniref:Uncharacterized protein n=1 Tax=bioreactor metagenome TaxID=1076179 RepID=A0A644ZX27_9ZZZZ